ncbi:MFS transporter [Martelella alba]|uniref:MFS transporter n=1 Tax=Martelella alba TaxID=2590451 RepID=A0ABY2SQ89_9HYPH|nr:MFS transporter [Martelella alba]TKI08136.1 MFS transporter [Martelella alba]
MTKLPARRWFYLMPTVFITYSLSYLDKANYSFASAAGIGDDLGINPSLASLIGALFFLGYFTLQIPGGMLAEKWSVRKLLTWSLVLWGICATLTGLVTNIASLIVIRFALGVVEAIVTPSLLLLVSRWFTHTERSKANTLFLLGNPVTVLWMSILSGWLVQHWGWRHMFVVEGLPAVVWAMVWWTVIRDKPEQAPWLNEEEKMAVAGALTEEQRYKEPMTRWGEVLGSANVIKLAGWMFFQSIGFFGFMMWLPSILHSGAISMSETGLLSALPYGLAAISMVIVAWLSDKLQKRVGFVAYPILVAGCCFLALPFLGAGHFWLSYFLLVITGACLYIPFGPFFALVHDVLPSSMVGGAGGMINSMAAMGAFIGSYLVGMLNSATHSTDSSYFLMAACLGIAVVFAMTIKPRRAGHMGDIARHSAQA